MEGDELKQVGYRPCVCLYVYMVVHVYTHIVYTREGIGQIFEYGG
jgi:hypothetical protein